MNLRKMPVFFLILALLNLITILTAPYTIPPNTVRGADGGANVIDSYDRWDELNPYARIVYTFGDLNCHQKESRSFILNDNQMPVCARDTGLAVGFLIGSLLFIFTIPNSSPVIMTLTPFLREKATAMHGKKAAAIVATMCLIFTAPIAVDGLMQAWTSYESTNPLRFATGLLFGWVLVLGLGVYLESYLYRHIYDREEPITDVGHDNK